MDDPGNGDDLWQAMLAEQEFWSQLLDDAELWRRWDGLSEADCSAAVLKHFHAHAPDAPQSIQLIRAQKAGLVAALVQLFGLPRTRELLKEQQH